MTVFAIRSHVTSARVFTLFGLDLGDKKVFVGAMECNGEYQYDATTARLYKIAQDGGCAAFCMRTLAEQTDYSVISKEQFSKVDIAFKEMLPKLKRKWRESNQHELYIRAEDVIC